MGSRASQSISAFAAQVAHAAVEGAAFVWTKEGTRAFLLVHSLALMWALGPKKTVSLGLQCSLACSAARFCIVLAGSSTRGNPKKNLESIWDFEPPGDLGESGAWKVLKELAMTMSMGADSHEELQGLEMMPLHKLIVRLALLYKHVQENPVADSISEEDVLGHVASKTVESLCKYLYFADQSYDCGTESNLKEVLAEHGYDLNFAKLESTWAEHCPAYFVATHSEAKEFLVTVRGTAQVEDIVTDLTALPTELGSTGHLVHSGIHASALWLFDRLLSVSQAMHKAGYRIKLVGHSLGAGAAALMTIMFKHSGLSNVDCYAFATPNCTDLALSDECSEYVMSVVFRDDIIARFSPEALAGLHKQISDFDVEKAMKKAEKQDDKFLRFISFLGRRTAVAEANTRKGEQATSGGKGASASSASQQHNGNGEKKAEEPRVDLTEKRERSYRPHIPGRVLYIHRCQLRGKDEPAEHQLTLVKSTCPALRCIRLSDKVVTDHLIDSYFQGFGRKNPSKERLEKQNEKNSKLGDGSAEEPKQTAEARDKEEKDKWRDWKARFGLVG